MVGTSRFGCGADFRGEAADGKPVAIDAETAQRSEGGLGGERVMAEFLTRVNVADVHFDGRNLHRHQRVMQRDPDTAYRLLGVA